MKILKTILAIICFTQLNAQDTTGKTIYIEIPFTSFDLTTRIQQTRVTLENGDVMCGYFNPSDSFFYDCVKTPKFRVGKMHFFSSGAGCCTAAQGNYMMTVNYGGYAVKYLPLKDVEGILAEIKTDPITKKKMLVVSDKNAVFELKFDEAAYEKYINKAAVGLNYSFSIK
jgi:hypothetical protein